MSPLSTNTRKHRDGWLIPQGSICVGILPTRRFIDTTSKDIGTLMACLLFALSLLVFANACADTHTNSEIQMLRDFGLLQSPPIEQETIRVKYTGAPVPVSLGVNVERRMIFEQPFRLGIDPEYSQAFDFEIYDHNLLITANRPLTTRAKIQLADGRIIPLDIESVVSSAITAPLKINTENNTTAEQIQQKPATPPPLGVPIHQAGYVELVRFAAERLYAPTRLFSNLPGIIERPVEKEPVRLLRGVRIRSTPLASWQSGNLIVTAVRLDNQESRRLSLDPRDIRGIWKAAAFQHPSLDQNASTALYVVSDRPFIEALGMHAHIPPTKNSNVARIRGDR